MSPPMSNGLPPNLVRDPYAGSTGNAQGQLVSLAQVQAIQGAKAASRPKPDAKWRRFRRVRVGSDIRVAYGPTSMRTGPSVFGLCGEANQVISCPPQDPPTVDRDDAEATAVGVAEGLRRAPLITTVDAPWMSPGYRAIRYPRTAQIVLSTFGATNVRTVQVQKALVGYLGTTNAPTLTVVPVANQSVQLFAFNVPAAYRCDEFTIACQDLQLLTTGRFTVAVNGNVMLGPFGLVGGKAKVAIQARRGSNVAVNFIMRVGDSFACPIDLIVDGWIYPATTATDGTYSKVLRSSPGWPGSKGSI